MLKLDLSKEIKKPPIATKQVIQEVKLLLDSSTAEDKRILKGLGTKHNLLRAEKLNDSKLELEQIEEKYDGQVFNEAEIKKLAVEYRLKFLKTKYFTGDIDVTVVSKIKEFALRSEIELSQAILENKFYILAPKEQFSLKDEYVLRKKDLDPIIFYSLDDGLYKMIHKWGTDFTILRRIQGFKWENGRNYTWMYFFKIFPVFAFLVGLCGGTVSTTLYWGIFVLLSVIPSLIFVFSTRKSHDNWEEVSKLFTPHNWDKDLNYY